jgi:hypothetical protein
MHIAEEETKFGLDEEEQPLWLQVNFKKWKHTNYGVNGNGNIYR